MRITVKYFAHFREITGTDEEELYIPDSLRVRDLLLLLLRKYPGLREYINLESNERQMNRMVLVQYGEFLRINDNLKEGVVMILPPIAGG